ncbi:ATP-binding cassette domain-containing protein [Enterococcus avium]|uniref:ATP-binding cassette domain-containing protein n=1 Tax=Enterococcus avium TaxID=33945 RepID=UPI00209DD284|nr:ATP-binding cassette domain-containing protein [Enterococcus avium]MDT2424588.1 ATP-binding cassette domain-containing protein [Enterococcus avium]
MVTTTILEINNLRKSYGQNEILKGINLQLLPGKITGLLGRNGAGKTTLMKCILGLTANYQGEMTFNGQYLNTTDTQTKMKIGSLVDVQFYEDLNAYDNLMLSIRLIDSIPRKKKKTDDYGKFRVCGTEQRIQEKGQKFFFRYEATFGFGPITDYKTRAIDFR